MHLVNLYIIYTVLAVPAMALVRTAEEEPQVVRFSLAKPSAFWLLANHCCRHDQLLPWKTMTMAGSLSITVASSALLALFRRKHGRVSQPEAHGVWDCLLYY